MADSFVQLPDDAANTGKKVRTNTRVVGSDTVHEHAFNLIEPLPAGTNDIGTVELRSETDNNGDPITKMVQVGGQDVNGDPHVIRTDGVGNLVILLKSPAGNDAAGDPGFPVSNGIVQVGGSDYQIATKAQILKVNASGELALPTGAASEAKQTQPGVDIGDVTVNNGSGASAVNVQDGGNSLTVDGSVAVSSSALPTGAATAALQTQPGVDIGDVTVNNAAGAAAVNVQDGGNSLTIDAASLPLPTGAATEAKQTQPGVDIGDVTINNAAGASAVNIQDGGNSITVDVASLPLPTGAATETTLAAAAASLSVMDDWDESDRAKVNPIVGQAGVQGGSGVVGATTQRVTLATDVALPSGANAIGKLAANSGVDIGDVDVTSVIPGVGATNLGKAEDAAHSSGDVGVQILAVRNDNGNTLAGSNGDYSPVAVTSMGAVVAAGFDVDDSFTTQPLNVDSQGRLKVTVPDGVAASLPPDATSTTTFTTTSTSSAGSIPSAHYWALQVTGTGGAATAWSVVVEVSLDLVNWTTILTHGTVDGNGTVVFLSTPKIGAQFRLRCVSLTLGGATNIVARAIGRA